MAWGGRPPLPLWDEGSLELQVSFSPPRSPAPEELCLNWIWAANGASFSDQFTFTLSDEDAFLVSLMGHLAKALQALASCPVCTLSSR